MDAEPGRDLGAVLTRNDHPLVLHRKYSLLRHDGELSPATQETKIRPLELANRAAGHQVDESPLLQLPEAVRGPQTADSDAKRRDVRGFVGWSTHWYPQTV